MSEPGSKPWALEATLLPVMFWDLTVEPQAPETTGGLQAEEKHSFLCSGTPPGFSEKW